MTSTIGTILRQATTAFAASPSPRLDAEVLVMHVTGRTRAQLITHADQPLSADQEQNLNALLARRAQGEPIAYLTGRREFWSMELQVTPDVLIPRPETELLVEQVLARIPQDAEWAIADLGTGSGAIALALAKERPHCRVIATDASEHALAVARANAARLGIRNVEFRHGEWFAPFAGMQFDLVVSNPPYVAEGDPHLSEGDVRFEPRMALVAGPEGLRELRRIALEAPRFLKPGGFLFFEHGADQYPAVRQLLTELGFRDIECVPDLAARPRVSLARAAR